MRCTITSILLLISSLGFSQEFNFGGKNTLIRGGITVNLGSHINRLGVYTGIFYRLDRIELSARLDLKYAGLMMGPRLKGIETLFKTGVKVGFAEGSENLMSRAAETELLSLWRYTMGYHINWYFNDMNTDQRTGTIAFRIDKVEITHENDILGEVASDKFRTAAFGMYYHDSLNIYGLETVLWTGDKDDEKARRVYDDTFARFGYIDLSSTTFGKHSHGILSSVVKRDIGFGMIAEAKVGIDHEKIRNTVQNKFMHDMYFWPEQWNKAKNLHIPMLDRAGNAYLYREDQILKEGSLFLQLNLNAEKFY